MSAMQPMLHSVLPAHPASCGWVQSHRQSAAYPSTPRLYSFGPSQSLPHRHSFESTTSSSGCSSAPTNHSVGSSSTCGRSSAKHACTCSGDSGSRRVSSRQGPRQHSRTSIQAIGDGSDPSTSGRGPESLDIMADPFRAGRNSYRDSSPDGRPRSVSTPANPNYNPNLDPNLQSMNTNPGPSSRQAPGAAAQQVDRLRNMLASMTGLTGNGVSGGLGGGLGGGLDALGSSLPGQWSMGAPPEGADPNTPRPSLLQMLFPPPKPVGSERRRPGSLPSPRPSPPLAPWQQNGSNGIGSTTPPQPGVYVTGQQGGNSGMVNGISNSSSVRQPPPDPWYDPLPPQPPPLPPPEDPWRNPFSRFSSVARGPQMTVISEPPPAPAFTATSVPTSPYASDWESDWAEDWDPATGLSEEKRDAIAIEGSKTFRTETSINTMRDKWLTPLLDWQAVTEAIDPDQESAELSISGEALVNKEESQTAVRYAARLFLIPLVSGFVISRLLAGPILNFTLQRNESAFAMTERQKVEGAHKVHVEEARIRMDAAIGRIPALSEAAMVEHLAEFAEEVQEEEREHNEASLITVVADTVAGIVLAGMLSQPTRGRRALRNTLARLFDGLSNIAKAVAIILVADTLLGYHSEEGWTGAIELFLGRYGVEAEEQFVVVFVSIVPVVIDVFFKYWIFVGLNKISPGAVVTIKEIDRH